VYFRDSPLVGLTVPQGEPIIPASYYPSMVTVGMGLPSLSPPLSRAARSLFYGKGKLSSRCLSPKMLPGN
jgi:hypothetical protein